MRRNRYRLLILLSGNTKFISQINAIKVLFNSFHHALMCSSQYQLVTTEWHMLIACKLIYLSSWKPYYLVLLGRNSFFFYSYIGRHLVRIMIFSVRFLHYNICSIRNFMLIRNFANCISFIFFNLFFRLFSLVGVKPNKNFAYL